MYPEVREDEWLRQVVRGIAGTVGQNFLESAVIEMAKIISAEFVFVGRLEGRDKAIQTMAMAAYFASGDNMRYELLHTPCAEVIGESACMYQQGVCKEFPRDQLLVDMGIDGYLGVPLRGTDGAIIGILVALYKRPIPRPELTKAVFEFLAERIGAELERVEGTRQLHDRVSELEQQLSRQASELESLKRLVASAAAENH